MAREPSGAFSVTLAATVFLHVRACPSYVVCPLLDGLDDVTAGRRLNRLYYLFLVRSPLNVPA